MAYLSWFKFTPSDWIMGKIQRTPEITQARFMRLICLYWNKQCILSLEDAEIEIDKEHIDLLVLKKIIKIEDNFLIIEFLNEQMGTITETSQKRKEAVLQRWAKVKQNDTSVSKVNTSVLQSDTDKIRKEEIIKDNNNDRFYSELIISESWIENTAMQSKQRFIPIEVKRYLKQYNDMINVQFEIKINKTEYCTHFINWLNKQEKKSAIKKPSLL